MYGWWTAHVDKKNKIPIFYRTNVPCKARTRAKQRAAPPLFSSLRDGRRRQTNRRTDKSRHKSRQTDRQRVPTVQTTSPTEHRSAQNQEKKAEERTAPPPSPLLATVADGTAYGHTPTHGLRQNAQKINTNLIPHTGPSKPKNKRN